MLSWLGWNFQPNQESRQSFEKNNTSCCRLTVCLLMTAVFTPETCRSLTKYTENKIVHQVGFSLHECVEMRGQQNIKHVA